MSLNKAVLLGRLTKDVELRSTQSGTPVCSFSIAVNRNGKDAGTDFPDIVAFGKTAEFVSKYFTKGQLVAVAGRIQTRNWEDKEGHKRKSTEMVIEEWYFCDSKPQNSQQASNAEVGDPMAALGGFTALPGNDSDLPF